MEYKFRAWDKSRNKMFKSPMWVEFSVNVEGKLSAKNYDMGGMEQNLSIMQFTGRHDNDGAEIFSGDIISDHVGIGVVEYVDKHAAFRVNYRDGQAKWFYDYNLKGEKESIEVIGNIHEHSELLNE